MTRPLLRALARSTGAADALSTRPAKYAIVVVFIMGILKKQLNESGVDAEKRRKECI